MPSFNEVAVCLSWRWCNVSGTWLEPEHRIRSFSLQALPDHCASWFTSWYGEGMGKNWIGYDWVKTWWKTYTTITYNLQWSIPLCRFCDIYPPKGPKPRFCPSSLTLTAKLTLRCPPVPSPLPLLRSIDEWHGNVIIEDLFLKELRKCDQCIVSVSNCSDPERIHQDIKRSEMIRKLRSLLSSIISIIY